jgi:hypothetical protein
MRYHVDVTLIRDTAMGHTSMMNLADKLATDAIEYSSKAIIATCNNEIPRWQRPCLKYAIGVYWMCEALNLFQARKPVFIDTIVEIRNK